MTVDNAAQCVFCDRILNHEYDTTTDASIVRFEPLRPVTPGHQLFLPRTHVDHAAERTWLTGITFEVAADYAAQREEEFNLITSAGPLATQSVYHLHIHYIPRRPDDGLLLPWSLPRVPPQQYAQGGIIAPGRTYIGE